ncbi:MAG: hypothetical protein LBV28_03995 [Puniceicoccales bacterium]|jgi:hypothetical protein|nr:hypothetical protein [Puniceicoccales bacterium]
MKPQSAIAAPFALLAVALVTALAAVGCAKTPEVPQTPKAPEAPKTPEKPKAPKAPEAPKAPSISTSVQISPAAERPAFMATGGYTHTGAIKMDKDAAGLLVFNGSHDLGPQARVLQVVNGEHADIVLLEGGYRQNIRPGVVLSIEQAGEPIALLVNAESTEDNAAALILNMAPKALIQAGDTAKIKTTIL